MPMKTTIIIVSFLWVLILSDCVSSSSSRQLWKRSRRHRKLTKAPRDQRIPNSYIVILAPKEDDINAKAEDLLKLAVGTEEDSSSGGPHIDNIYHNVLNGFTVSNFTDEELYKVLESDKVRSVEENQIVSYASTTIKEQINATWGLDRIDQDSLPLDNHYHYLSAGYSNAASGESNVSIYVVDSGLDVSHPEFRERSTCGIDIYDNGCKDADGHGTHVAGTAAGKTYGVAKNANLIGVRVLGDNGRGKMSAIIAGVDWVTQQRSHSSTNGKAMIANLSIEAPLSKAFNEAVTNGWNAGVVMISAAGNDGELACTSSPASAEKSITVASTNIKDERAWFSNYGSCVDIFAPGEDILSSSPGDKTRLRSGTSMSVPLVSGAAALYMETNVNMKPDQVRQAILRDAIPNIVSNEGSGSPNLFLSVQPASSFAQMVQPSSSFAQVVQPSSSFAQVIQPSSSFAQEGSGLPISGKSLEQSSLRRPQQQEIYSYRSRAARSANTGWASYSLTVPIGISCLLLLI